MRRFDVSLLCGLILSILLSSFTAFAAECRQMRQHVVRLHVLANSDSEPDQQLKQKVRDAVLDGTAELFSSPRTEKEAKAAAQENLARIEAIARAELADNGCGLSARAEVCSMFFDTQVYGDIVVPAGRYDAVRIVIGEGKGRNWWCVLFPPMCVPAASERVESKEAQELSEQIERLGGQPRYTPKFALLELIEEICDKSL